MEQFTLTAKLRETVSKKDRKIFKKDGMIPAIFYGKHIEKNLPIFVDSLAVKKIIKKEGGTNAFIKLEIAAGVNKSNYLSIIKDIQFDSIYRIPIHVDFYAVEEKEELEANVPVVAKGTSIGVKNGGILQILRKELTVRCLPQYLPEKIEIDVTNLDFHDSVHIEALSLPNVKFLFDSNFTVLTIASPTKETEAKVETTEETTGENA